MATAIDEQGVRQAGQAFGDALVSGDVDQALESLSQELRRNAGEVLGLLPLPVSEVGIDSLERTGAGYNAVLRLTGETSEDLIQTRWKDRDGHPTIVEVSHLSRVERAAPAEDVGAEESPPPGADVESG
jgi:hypothetical protein